VKNKLESVEKTKPKHLLCVTSVIFRSNKVCSKLETHSKKATTVGESNNEEVWGAELPAAGGQRGFGGGASNASAILQLFFQNIPKMRIFEKKAVKSPKRYRLRGACPHLPPSPGTPPRR